MSIKKRISTRLNLFINSLLKNCILLLIPLLVIAPYSIYRSISDNSSALEKNMALTLEQFDSTFNTILSHVDNATYFFSSNPRVILQLNEAFRESKITLESQKNVTNLSLYFQNLLYTNDSFSNIYIYYKNENHRIFKPSISAMYALKAEEEQLLLEIWENYPEQNTWVIPIETTLAHSDAPERTLYIMRKLFSPGTASASGLLVFECNLNRTCQALDKLMQHSNQTYYIFDSDDNYICSNTASDSLKEAAQKQIVAMTQEDALQMEMVDVDDSKYLWASYSSIRQDGFTYVNMVPYAQMYQSSLHLAHIYILLTCCSILLAFLLSLIKTNQEYRYLNTIIDLFSNPQHASAIPLPQKLPTSNPLNYITYNLVHLFLEQDYLKVQASEKESKMQLLKLQMLQYQINPHFMHNTLNSIYWEAVQMTSSENACSTMIYNLSSLMRYSLGSPDEDTTLKDEFDYVKIYIEIMKKRFPDKYQVYYHSEKACSDFPVKRMLLQPIVENAIYHGIKPKTDSGVIHIGAKLLHRHVVIYIYDNGVGISAKELELLRAKLCQENSFSSGSVGLKNTNSRLTYAYGSGAAIRIKSIEGKYTLIYFFLPVTNFPGVCYNEPNNKNS